MTAIMNLDFETRSDVELKTHGVYRYFESTNADVLMACYSFDGGKTLGQWLRGDPCPQVIVDHVRNGGTIHAHNAAFERLAWWMVLCERYCWPKPALEQFRCTAVTAAAHQLPRDLAGVGAALGLDVQKDKEGMRLINKFSKPRKARKGEDPSGLYWNEPEDHPEDFQKFVDYCGTDVRVEAAVGRRLVPQSKEETELYHISERINDRGIRIDRTSVRAALRLAGKAKRLLDKEMTLVTGGYVTACTQVGALKGWVLDQGIEVPSLAKKDVEELLGRTDLPANVERALNLRKEAAKSTVSKFGSAMKRVTADGTVKGAFLFHAAGTGRWSSVGLQLHNLSRPGKLFEKEAPDLNTLFSAFRREDPDYLKVLYGDDLGRALWLLSDAIRGFLWAKPGHDLLAVDYSGVEGAVSAWLAREDWKLKAMYEIMADKTLPDMYRRAAASILNTTTDVITKDHPARQGVGKVSELSMGFGGGVGAFNQMARNYDVKLPSLFEPVWEAATPERRADVEKRYEERLKASDALAMGMQREGWMAAETIKLGWREAHPGFVATWKAMEDAVWDAITNPGSAFEAGRCKFMVRANFLWLMLPSGRCLAYGNPKIKDLEVPWADQALPESEREKRPTPTAMGLDSKNNKVWRRRALYGGLVFQNATQAVARDLMANGMRRAEAAGYPVVLHVHDELVAQVPRGFGDVNAYAAMVAELPRWAYGIPLMASGWRGKRYRK